MKKRKSLDLLRQESLSRREFLRLSALLGAGAALYACGPTPTPSPPTATPMPPTSTPVPSTPTPAGPSGTLTVIQTQDPDTMDPYLTMNPSARSIHKSVAEPLYDRWRGFTLAETVEFPDDLTWRWHLRKGVKFHNGDDFNAEAVKFSMERWVDPELAAPYASLLEPVERIEIVDDYTVDVITKEPYGVLDEALTDVLILSPRAVSDLGEQIAMDMTGVGTGPFRFVEFVPGERAVVEANGDYWEEGVPRIETVIYKPVPEAMTRITELKTEAADVIGHIPPHMLSEVEAIPGVHITQIPSVRHAGITLNCAEPPFDDVRVRQAVNYAVNKEEIVEFVFFKGADVAAGPLSPVYHGYNPDLKPYPYDPEKAKALLAEAGYPDGFEVTINTSDGRFPGDKAATEAISEQLADVGIKMNVVAEGDFPTFLKHYRDVNGFMISSDMYPTQKALTMDFDCSAQAFAWHGYCNEEVDALIAEAARTLDREERGKIYQEICKIVRDEAAWLWLAVLRVHHGVRDRVKNWEPNPDDPLLFRDAYLAD
jgi:peptide/nickel transport system substrate-binding protein